MAPSDPEILLRETEWVTRLARRLLGDGPDADDLAQETLVRAMRGGRGGPGSDAPQGRTRAWLGRIARNVSWERRRADARREAREADVARPEASPGDPEAVERALLQRVVIDEVLALEEPERSAVVLRFLEGLPYESVAARQGVSPATARKRVSRALANVRARLERREGGLASLAPLLVPLPVRVAATAAEAAAATTSLLAMALPAKLALAATALFVLALSAAQLTRPDPDAVERDVRVAVERERTSNPARTPTPQGASSTPTDRRAIEGPVAAESAEAPAPTHAFVGRVVDTWRRPVAGAVVHYGWDLDGRDQAISDDEGAFRLEVVAPPDPPADADYRFVLVARDSASRVGAAWPRWQLQLDDEPCQVDVGALVLEEGHPLTVRVTGPAGPAPGAMVKVWFTHARLPGGDHTTDGSGALRLDSIPAGAVVLEARLEGGTARRTAFVPDVGHVDLATTPGRSVVVTILGGEDGEPLEGATLEVTERLSVRASYSHLADRSMNGEYSTTRPVPSLGAVTAPDGRAVLGPLLADVRYLLRATAPGRTSAEATVYADSDVEALEMVLEPAVGRTVRWPIAQDGAVVPAGGSEVAVEPRRDYRPGRERLAPTGARIEGGALVVEGVQGNANLDVRTADGALARAYVDAETSAGRTIAFEPSRSIEVVVNDPAGAPVAGARVEARNQGNNQVGPTPTTNADGRALLEGFRGRRFEVYVDPPEEDGAGQRLAGTVDLSGGDARLDVTLTPAVTRRATLRVHVDGAPRLPARFSLRSPGGLHLVGERPDDGEIDVTLVGAAAGVTSEVWFNAPGFARPEIEVPFASDVDVPIVRVDLERVTRLVADVIPPRDGDLTLRVDRYDEEKDTWASERLRIPRMTAPNGPDGTFVFDGLGPGRWRVFDERSSTASEPITIESGSLEARVALDLGSSALVEGTVRVDDPAELARTRIVVRGEDGPATGAWQEGAGAPRGVRLREGRFRVRIPGDREVTVAPLHPWLVPAADGGSITLTEGRDGVVLRLVEGDSISLAAPQLGPDSSPSAPRWAPRVRVGRWPAGTAPDSRPLEWHAAEIVGGHVRAAVPAGRWTLLVEPGTGFAPLTLEDVVVDGPTALAPAEFSRGSTARIRLLVKEGADPPRISAYASRIDAPKYVRGLNSNGESIVEIVGLGAGRFDLRMGAVMSIEDRVQEVIEVDGENDVELDLDLR
ncbi:MAG: sigma-70 family RNA polymerase sigma factor [Planctomycetota bacterium]